MAVGLGILRACLETQKLEQLEARMDEIISLIPHRRRRTWRQWARVDLDHAIRNARAVGDELLGKRGGAQPSCSRYW
jgi:hypothetical protein